MAYAFFQRSYFLFIFKLAPLLYNKIIMFLYFKYPLGKPQIAKENA